MVNELTKEEMLDYLDKLYDRLLEHRYRYYVLDHPAIEDSEYDYVERFYNNLASEHGVKQMEMVDFNPNDLLTIQAKNRVDSETDNYSIWYKSMTLIWDKLGLPHKTRKANKI
jgi:NAD-dependent DNA ligase adenylation domain